MSQLDYIRRCNTTYMTYDKGLKKELILTSLTQSPRVQGSLDA